MDLIFLFFLIGVIVVVPAHFVSVEHQKLEAKYGRLKGRRIGNILGLISGWGFFAFWAGVWFSPQPRFLFPFLADWILEMPLVELQVSLFHLFAFVPFFLMGAWLGIAGVRETTLRVAETHRAEKIVSSGVYSVVRHPQYLGGLLAHVSFSFLLSAWFSLLSTPLMVFLVFLISRKEEMELIKEFGVEYLEYRKKVPMLFPKLRG
jgi:protein-S-isoprenylcysteine O-methyltransferase Ste14